LFYTVRSMGQVLAKFESAYRERLDFLARIAGVVDTAGRRGNPIDALHRANALNAIEARDRRLLAETFDMHAAVPRANHFTAIVREYGGRIVFVSKADRGQAHATNKGFGLAKGNVLAWLNFHSTAARKLAKFVGRSRSAPAEKDGSSSPVDSHFVWLCFLQQDAGASYLVVSVLIPKLQGRRAATWVALLVDGREVERKLVASSGVGFNVPVMGEGRRRIGLRFDTAVSLTSRIRGPCPLDCATRVSSPSYPAPGGETFLCSACLRMGAPG